MDKIIIAKITCSTGFGAMCSIGVITEGGSARKLNNYFPDELHFTESEFIGLTIEEAEALCRKRDTEYLQS